MKIQTRLFWLAIIVAVQLLYFPINQHVQGGIIIATPLDAYIPLWSIWAVPYLLSLLWWQGSFLWAVWKMEANLYLALVIATLFVLLSSYLIYLLVPTHLERPILTGDSWTMDLVRFIYSRDRPYNVFPSGHTYMTVLVAIFWTRWYPKKQWLWIIIALVVLLSTLFTGQHYVLDLVSGTLLAWAGYRLGIYLTTKNTILPSSK